MPPLAPAAIEPGSAAPAPPPPARPVPAPAVVIGTPRTARTLLAGLRAQWGADAAGWDAVTLGGVTGAPGVADADQTPGPLPAADPWGTLARRVAHGTLREAFVCLPRSMAAAAARAEDLLRAGGVKVTRVPPLAEWLEADDRGPGRAGGAFCPASLIDREPRPLDAESLRRLLGGRRVLITGAGGSIGGELARRVAGFGPAELTLVERSENALFEVDRQVGEAFTGVPRRAELHDVTQTDRTARLLSRLRPEVVLHAAAHKHVPMMEEHPALAVDNNFHGTRSVADAAAAAGCGTFVMISTDKAVNPTSVMGATKRLAERYVQHLDRLCDTTFCMVRFGNVLGSACSLIPIWTRQLAAGGPLTVTHRDMTRYFMTLPEAAGLVLQAGGYARGGEVFLLDMGKPVRIVDMADRFLRAHGLEPGRDVAVRVTGPRPGEKLFEELACAGEDMTPTPHPSINRWRQRPASAAEMRRVVSAFDRLRPADGFDPDPRAVVAALRLAVPEMRTAAAAAAVA